MRPFVCTVCLLKNATPPTVFIIEWLDKLHLIFFFYHGYFFFWHYCIISSCNIIYHCFISSCNIIYHRFIVVYIIHFTHSLYYCVLLCSSLLLQNYTFSARNLSSPNESHSFWLRWLKQMEFYSELNALDPYSIVFAF